MKERYLDCSHTLDYYYQPHLSEEELVKHVDVPKPRQGMSRRRFLTGQEIMCTCSQYYLKAQPHSWRTCNTTLALSHGSTTVQTS